MKHSIEDIHRALEFYKEKGTQGSGIILQKVVAHPPQVSFGPLATISPSYIKNIEFSLRELVLYDSKMLRVMYA